MYCPKGIAPRNGRDSEQKITHCANLWLSKSRCYERPCCVTGVGEVRGQKLASKLRHVDRYKGTGEAINMESAYSMKL